MKSFIPNPKYQIEVFDGIFSYERQIKIFESINELPFTFTNFDHSQFSITYKKFWSLFYVKDRNIDNQLYSHFLSLLEPEVNSLISQRPFLSNFELHRGYVNYANSSNIDRVHVDGFTKEEYTILIYPNTTWDLDWGGETLFYDPYTMEIISAVKPTPGRVVIFSGSIPHSARPPQINCPYPRYTIALKFLPKN